MNWIEAVGGIWLRAALWMVGLGVGFLILTRFSPCNPGRNWWTDRRAAVTDLFYWLLLPLVTQLGRVAFLVAGALLLYGNEPTDDFALRSLPLWAQCGAILLIQDVLLYWIHRLFHTRAGWRFHAIHHSPEVLDWTSTQRFHPVNAIAEFALADAVVLLMGFSPMALAILGPINLIYSVMVHANLNWTFGPLRYVFASPVFHRWHHTSEDEGVDRNFAPTFPFLDLAFGTFHMPAGKRPEVYGAGDVPTGFVGQMLHPFQGLQRRPLLASACALVAAGVAFAGWRELAKPIPSAEVVADSSETTTDEPALLRFTPAEPKRDASAVAISGSRAIYGTTDGRVAIRDLAANSELALEGHSRRVNGAGFSPNGSLAITASGDGTARVFDAATGRHLRSLLNHGTTAMSAAIGDDGWAVTGAVDGTVRLWNPDGQLAKKRSFGAGSIHAVALSRGGSTVVVAQATGVSRWESGADRVLACSGLKELAYCVAIGADGQRIAAGDYSGQLLVWESGSERSTVAIAGHTGPIYALDADGSTIATGGADRAVKLWDARSGANRGTFDGAAGSVFAVALDRNRIVAAGKDGSLRSWNRSEPEILPVGATEKAE